MPAFRNIFISLSSLCLASGYYLHKEKVDLKNQYLRKTLTILHNKNPDYSAFLFRQMIRLSMIKRSDEMKDYVFSYGFDFDGFYLDGLTQIGFNTVQVGPVSLIFSCKEQSRTHFGNKIALANINSFWQEKKHQASKQKQTPTQQNNHQSLIEQTKRQSKIGICITPNYQVLHYAPYLIQQNMLYCLKELQQLNTLSPSLQVSHYILKLNDSKMKQTQTPQYLTMIQQLITNAHKTIEQTYSNNLQQFNNSKQLKKPQILVQIPNQDQNPQLYETVKQIPQVQKVIVDGAEFNITRTVQKPNKKTLINKVQLTVGKRRISFQQLLEKVVNDTF